MMSKKQFIKSQMDCASILGMSLSEYEDYCKDLKVPKEALKQNKKTRKYDNSILKSLGLTPKDLKMKRGY